MPTTETYECEDCDSRFPSLAAYDDHRFYCDDCDSDYCGHGEGCRCEMYGGRGSRGTGVHNYSYTPRLRFHGHGDYHLGMELEISTDYGASAHPIYDWAESNGYPNVFYVKEDGSVEGFEIVTHPMTPEFFESFPWESFFNMLNETYPLEGRQTERVGHGLHVHVSRTAFTTPLALARWTYLLNRGGERMARVARRSESRWAMPSRTPVKDVMATDARLQRRFSEVRYDRVPRYCDCDGCRALADQDMRRVDGWDTREIATRPGRPVMPRRPDRYLLTNHTNEHTVEVRAFRSTRQASEFRDSIRAVYSSVDFVRNMQACHACTTREAIAWDTYAAYVAETLPSLYPVVSGELRFAPAR